MAGTLLDLFKGLHPDVPAVIPPDTKQQLIAIVTERLFELRFIAPHKGLNAIRAASRYKVASFSDYVKVLGILQQLSNEDMSNTDISNLATDLVENNRAMLDLIL